jgi:membrane-bound lytic murein transglycosylase A
MQRIRDWMTANPDEAKEVRRTNKSYVFFRITALGPQDEAVGGQGVPLVPGRSIAIDRALHAYGTPFFITADLPIANEKNGIKFRRLMVGQDTGSAIVGPARADIYFGHGEEISHIAGRIKQNGQFVMLAPKSVAISGTAVATNVPLPKPRPAMIVTAAARSATETTSSVTVRLPKRRP